MRTIDKRVGQAHVAGMRRSLREAPRLNGRRSVANVELLLGGGGGSDVFVLAGQVVFEVDVGAEQLIVVAERNHSAVVQDQYSVGLDHMIDLMRDQDANFRLEVAVDTTCNNNNNKNDEWKIDNVKSVRISHFATGLLVEEEFRDAGVNRAKWIVE